MGTFGSLLTSVSSPNPFGGRDTLCTSRGKGIRQLPVHQQCFRVPHMLLVAPEAREHLRGQTDPDQKKRRILNPCVCVFCFLTCFLIHTASRWKPPAQIKGKMSGVRQTTQTDRHTCRLAFQIDGKSVSLATCALGAWKKRLHSNV